MNIRAKTIFVDPARIVVTANSTNFIVVFLAFQTLVVSFRCLGALTLRPAY